MCGASLKTSDKAFWIDYYDANGRRHRKKIGSQKTVAELALKDVKVKIAKGEYLGIYEEKKVFLRTLPRRPISRLLRLTFLPVRLNAVTESLRTILSLISIVIFTRFPERMSKPTNKKGQRKLSLLQ